MTVKESMNKIRERLISSAKSGEFLATVYDIYPQEKKGEDGLSQHLIDLHNAGEIDVIAEFRKLENTNKVYDFFITWHVLEPVLPKISAPVAKVLECVKHLTYEARDNMLAGSLIHPFIDFMSVDEERPKEALNIALAEIDEKFDFITPAILAGSRLNLRAYVSKAIELSQHYNVQTQTRALNALGGIEYNGDKNLIAQALVAIEAIIVGNFNDLLFASALRNSYSLYKHNNVLEKRVTKLFRSILKHQGDHILRVASIILWPDRDVPEPIVGLLLDALVHTKPENRNTLGYIGHGLKKLLEKKQAKETDVVIHFLERILLKEREISITQFDSVNMEIINNTEVLNQIVTRWLLSKKLKLKKSVADLFPRGSQKHYYLSVDEKQLIGLDKGVCSFLARKACGWFFSQPVSAVSFIVSLIDEASEDERQEIAEILFNPLLISYSGSVKEYLENARLKASETQILIINDVLARFEGYHKGLEAVRNTKELIPSIEHRETYFRYHTRLMDESMAESKKNSILNSIVTEQFILYGKKTINYFNHGPEEQGNRQEMSLRRHRFSVETPSLERLDHNGLGCTLLNFKLEGCTS